MKGFCQSALGQDIFYLFRTFRSVLCNHHQFAANNQSSAQIFITAPASTPLEEQRTTHAKSKTTRQFVGPANRWLQEYYFAFIVEATVVLKTEHRALKAIIITR
jgi:hypothetical protein